MRFSTILIDPPWDYSRTSKSEKLSGYSDSKYEPLKTSDLEELPIGQLASGVVIIWATGPFIPAAVRLIESWGLQYVTAGYWHKSSAPLGMVEGVSDGLAAFPHKPHYGVGYWLRGDTEPFLIAKTPGSPSYRTNERGTLHTRRSNHSEKPDSLHRLAETHLSGPYLEVFARRQRDGWTCVGDQCPGDGRDVRESLEALDAE